LMKHLPVINFLELSLVFARTTNAASADIRINAVGIPQQPDGSEILGMSAGFPTGGNPAKPYCSEYSVL
jgi:hypothetical protein